MGFHGGFRAKQIKFKASKATRAAIQEIGRTEDLHFSPNGKRLVIAAFKKDQLLVLDLQMTTSSTQKIIVAKDHLQFTSSHLNYPHGVFWIDDERLIVANRGDAVGVFELPRRKPASRMAVLDPVAQITKADFAAMSSPGSVSIFPRDRTKADVLVCHNYAHIVSHHTLHSGERLFFDNHKVFLKRGFDVPDGVTFDASGKFFAISNHYGKAVNLFDFTQTLHSRSKPVATLRGFSYPHGVRFSRDGRFLLVADAGEPFVHIFQRDSEAWKDQDHPAASFHVMSEEEYLRGHNNMEEGGPKGIALWEKHGLLAVTCEARPLAFFDVGSILENRGIVPSALQRRGTAPPAPEVPRPILTRIWKRLGGVFG